MKFKIDIGDSLLRRTLVVTGALVGACIAFVGSLTAIALLVASHAVGPTTGSKDSATPPSDTPAAAQPAKRPATRPATPI